MTLHCAAAPRASTYLKCGKTEIRHCFRMLRLLKAVRMPPSSHAYALWRIHTAVRSARYGRGDDLSVSRAQPRLAVGGSLQCAIAGLAATDASGRREGFFGAHGELARHHRDP